MGFASYLFTFVFIFRNLLWGSVNNGQPLHGLHYTKRLRTTGLSVDNFMDKIQRVNAQKQVNTSLHFASQYKFAHKSLGKFAENWS